MRVTKAVEMLALMGCVACSDAVTGPAAVVTNVASPTRTVSLDRGSVNVTTTWTMQNPCTAEDVFLTLDYSYRSQLLTTPSGRVTASNQISLRGEGVGLSTGTKYLLNDVQNWTFAVAPGFVANSRYRSKMITPGSESNYFWAYDFHQTVSASGEMTVNLSSVSIECRG